MHGSFHTRIITCITSALGLQNTNLCLAYLAETIEYTTGVWGRQETATDGKGEQYNTVLTQDVTERKIKLLCPAKIVSSVRHTQTLLRTPY